MMLLYSFADLGMNSGSIITSMYPPMIPSMMCSSNKPRSPLHRHFISPDIRKAGINWDVRTWFREDPDYDPETDEDLSPREDRVPTLWWTSGLLASIILSCAILATMFSMNVGEAILSLVLGFAFSFIGVQSAGTTDVNPVSTVAKVGSQQ